MKIAVIYGSDKNDIMYNHVNLLINNLKSKINTSVKEFFITKDLPTHSYYSHYSFLCDILKSSEYYKASDNIINYLNNAELIIIASSSYSHKSNIPLKYFLQYLAYLWMPHRPNKLMNSKMAVVIGDHLHGNFNITGYMAKQLHCWGIDRDSIFSKSFNIINSPYSYNYNDFSLSTKILNQYKKVCKLITPNFSANSRSDSDFTDDFETTPDKSSYYKYYLNSSYSLNNVYDFNSTVQYNSESNFLHVLNSDHNSNYANKTESNSNYDITSFSDKHDYLDVKYDCNIIPIKKKAKKSLTRLLRLKKVVYGYML